MSGSGKGSPIWAVLLLIVACAFSVYVASSTGVLSPVLGSVRAAAIDAAAQWRLVGQERDKPVVSGIHPKETPISGATPPAHTEPVRSENPSAAMPSLSPSPRPSPSPSRMVSPSPKPTPVPLRKMRVSVKAANVRIGPSTRFDKVETLGKGDVVIALGGSADGEWVWVETPSGVTGYISASLLSD